MSYSVNKVFGYLVRGAVNAIADFEGQNVSIIEAELSERICMAPTAIHRFKAGYIPRDPMIIEVLAEAGVTRAYLSRAWLQRFLHAARYHDSAALIERLLPSEPATPKPSRMYDNIPPATSAQFVMRAEPYAAVLEGLSQRCAIVVVVSLGGMGKTSLVREIAVRCLYQSDTDRNIPHFDAAVWISDKDTSGATSLVSVLDEIAYTLDYPGITQFDQARKCREVEQLLKRLRVLLIVDNFETIVDDALLKWLLRLPEPSKALITTREYRTEFQPSSWLVELGGMRQTEAIEFITARSRQLNLHLRDDDDLTHQLIDATGGNPKAIGVLLGLVKGTGQPLFQAINQLHTGHENVFVDLFEMSWSLLSQEAQHILLAMTLFPSSVASEVLAEVAGLDEATFFVAVRQLAELSLLDTEQPDDFPKTEGKSIRRTMHPLTRSFIETQYAKYIRFLEQARARWLIWAVQYASRFGYLVDDIRQLELLDYEEANLFMALTWAFDHSYNTEVIQLTKGIEFYYYVRGLWNKKLRVHQMYIEAACRLGNRYEEIMALSMHVQLLSRQGHVTTAVDYVSRLLELAQTEQPQSELFFHVEHALGLYQLAVGQTQLAEACWQRILDQADMRELPEHMVMGTQHWLALCLSQQERVVEARMLYEAALTQARQHTYPRMVARNQLQLAILDLDQGDVESATQRLKESSLHTQERDWEQRARVQQAFAHIYLHTGDQTAAREALLDAVELFDRMGLVLESEAARAKYQKAL
ncbi:MAG: NB-ARC domain-containing protein [Chloroflexota bacterium]